MFAGISIRNTALLLNVKASGLVAVLCKCLSPCTQSVMRNCCSFIQCSGTKEQFSTDRRSHIPDLLFYKQKPKDHHRSSVLRIYKGPMILNLFDQYIGTFWE